MNEMLKDINYGSNVQKFIRTDADRSQVFRLDNESGEGMMTVYDVFPGVFLMYNDFHMTQCISEFQSEANLFCIDYCREGRIEQEVTDGMYCYLEAGDLRIDKRDYHTGNFSFPLCHYHGISVVFQMDVAVKEVSNVIRNFSVDLQELQNKYCNNLKPYVIPQAHVIDHLFSELYRVPLKIKKDYFTIKILELLLYLDALELTKYAEERPYFYKGQIEKIKSIQALLTQDLTKHYTTKYLSNEFDISLTSLKNCFKSVYGKPLFTCMRFYRMNYAAALLKADKNLKISEIAGCIGYDSPSKFSAAFKKTMGMTPLEYRKSFI